jgi:hypothetical protein
MSKNELPPGWDQAKVKKAIAHYESQTDDEAVAEDEAGVKPSATVMDVPVDLVPKVRELIAKRER